MGQLQTADVNTMYSNLKNCPAIIFDIRNYPNGTAWPIANLMYPNHTMFSKLTEPDVTYPGTYTWYYDYLGVNGNTSPYTGRVIILMNEQTQSQAEFSCMILGNMTNSIKVGSQTAGADGNITYLKLSKDIQAGFTSLGVYYPNGDSTQRIGIRPDSLVYPTPMGIRHHRDEVLEKALQIANCLTSINDYAINTTLSIYPNPANDEITVMTNSYTGIAMEVFDVDRKLVFSKSVADKSRISIANLSEGVYTIIMKTSGKIVNTKLVIVR
jgi:C-terminal processing protease CtpA/Prc